MDVCLPHNKRLPCAHCNSQKGLSSDASRKRREKIFNAQPIGCGSRDDPEHRYRLAALRRRTTQTLPLTTQFMAQNGSSVAYVVFNGNAGVKKPITTDLQISPNCPPEVEAVMQSFFGDGGAVQNALKEAYEKVKERLLAQSRGQQLEPEEGPHAQDGEYLFEGEHVTGAGADTGERED